MRTLGASSTNHDEPTQFPSIQHPNAILGPLLFLIKPIADSNCLKRVRASFATYWIFIHPHPTVLHCSMARLQASFAVMVACSCGIVLHVVVAVFFFSSSSAPI